MNITLGSDVEFMLMKDGECHSAIGIVHGSKENRINLNGHQFFFDNVMAECAIKPAKSRRQWLKNIKECLQLYIEMVAPFELTPQSVAWYPKDQLENPDAKKAGCDPDWCAYEIKLKRPPIEEIRDQTFRTCGGHIHVGSKMLKTDGPDQIRYIYMMDLFLGIPSLLMDRNIARRSIYGQAGRYRINDTYGGMEYRSLSNFWFKSPKLAGWIYDAVKFAHEFVESGEAEKLWEFDVNVLMGGGTHSDAFECKSYDPWELKRCIDESDVDGAQQFIDLAKSLMSPNLREELESISNADRPVLLKDTWK